MARKYEAKICRSAKETRKLGEKLAEKILAQERENLPADRPAILALQGDLGGGKTTFLQGFAKGLGVKEKILSPTFVIMKKFQIPNYKLQTNSKSQNPKFKTFYHCDCYRIDKPEEVLELDFKKIVSDPKNIVAIEWPEKIRKILPPKPIFISFKFIDEQTRELTIKNNKILYCKL